MANSFKYVPVYESTKNRLDSLKGRKSYELMLDEMLTYFEQTGIVPTSRMVSPVVAMKEQSNRVIEVMRGIEKKENITLNAIYDLLKTISLGKHNDEKGEVIDDENENYIPVKDVQELLEKHKTLEENFRKLEIQNNSYSSKIKLLESEQKPENGVNTNILLEIIERLEETPKAATFNNSIYEIERTVFDALITRLKSELK